MEIPGHERWLALREEFRAAKRAKDWERVVAACDAILQHSAANRKLSIVDWLFAKDRAVALARMNRHQEAIDWYRRAIAGCKKYRATQRLREPDDFLKHVEMMEKRIASLSRKG